jgi:hypothetical protein
MMTLDELKVTASTSSGLRALSIPTMKMIPLAISSTRHHELTLLQPTSTRSLSDLKLEALRVLLVDQETPTDDGAVGEVAPEAAEGLQITCNCCNNTIAMLALLKSRDQSVEFLTPNARGNLTQSIPSRLLLFIII